MKYPAAELGGILAYFDKYEKDEAGRIMLSISKELFEPDKEMIEKK